MEDSPGGATATLHVELLSPLRGFLLSLMVFEGLAPLATRFRPSGAFKKKRPGAKAPGRLSFQLSLASQAAVASLVWPTFHSEKPRSSMPPALATLPTVCLSSFTNGCSASTFSA
ncbi:hypothetical protein K2D_45720 [Planctomycetes bacterium K2D]|uniref:Uncharacterized protein n=1 Tax=Botrimarina mediterranea TaxID=2528022 RepID=A0A518KEX3_9BACT|nr:hypothetical protein Spa11_45690 [Botrimarina mediterranea]QDV80937.1 hypothetical protein K2D_45720 [Planctomycetes bacterium K2D]